jgi:hypothetical protein
MVGSTKYCSFLFIVSSSIQSLGLWYWGKTSIIIIIIIIISGVGLSPLGTAATTGLLHQPQMIDDGDSVAHFVCVECSE